MEELERTILSHEFQIKSVKEAVERNDANTMNLRKDMEELEKSHYAVRDMVLRMVTSAEATQEYAKDIAGKAITVKQFYLGVAAVIVAILSLLLTVIGVRG